MVCMVAGSHNDIINVNVQIIYQLNKVVQPDDNITSADFNLHVWGEWEAIVTKISWLFSWTQNIFQNGWLWTKDCKMLWCSDVKLFLFCNKLHSYKNMDKNYLSSIWSNLFD